MLQILGQLAVREAPPQLARGCRSWISATSGAFAGSALALQERPRPQCGPPGGSPSPRQFQWLRLPLRSTLALRELPCPRRSLPASAFASGSPGRHGCRSLCLRVLQGVRSTSALAPLRAPSRRLRRDPEGFWERPCSPRCTPSPRWNLIFGSPPTSSLVLTTQPTNWT